MAAIYFGNRGTSLQMALSAMAEVGIRVTGPVLSGKTSVREGQQLVFDHAIADSGRYLGERDRLVVRASLHQSVSR